MPQLTLDMSTEEIKALILQLPAKDLLAIAGEIEARAQTIEMMQLAETAFQEWNEGGEEIYDAEP
jgi:hypothetical protein